MEGKNGRSGHFIKKKPKDTKRFTSDEPIRMDEKEHDETLRRLEKVIFSLRNLCKINFYNFLEITITE
jgi:hypothetical protein